MNRRNPAVRFFRYGGLRRPAGLMIIAVAIITGLIATPHASGVGAGGPETAQNETLVRCNPSTAAGIMGQPLAVEIYIENVVNLWAADIRLSFDTTMAHIIDANPAADGVQIEILDGFLSPDALLRQNGDNEAGTIWYAVTQIGSPIPGEGSQPVSGSGAVARITFTPLQAGTFTMPITYQKLVGREDNQIIEIEATATDCRITFIEGDDPDLITYLPVAFAQD